MPDLFTTHTGEVFSLEIPTTCERHNSVSASDYPSNIDGPSLPIHSFASQNLTIPDLDSTFDVHDPSAPPTLNTNTSTPVYKRRTSCGSTNPLIEIVDSDDLSKRHDAQDETTAANSDPMNPASQPISNKYTRRRSSVEDVLSLVNVKMVYNEYGEVVEEKDLNVRPQSDVLSVKQLLRVIKKAYHHEVSTLLFSKSSPGPASSKEDILTVRSSATKSARSLHLALMVKLLSLSMMVFGEIGCHLGTSEGLAHQDRLRRTRRHRQKYTPLLYTTVHLASWRLVAVMAAGASTSRKSTLIGLLRVLTIQTTGLASREILSLGKPISCSTRDLNDLIVLPRDFMTLNAQANYDDYFGIVYTSQEAPEFTMRNINSLLAHHTPIPHNLYEFIRAREIFDRIESYKTFLDDVRS